MIIQNISQNNIIASEAKFATSFITRLKGLLGTKRLDKGKALVISPCSSIHTVGMKYAIDVVFLDTHDRIVKIINDMPAGKFSLCRDSSYVIELPAGTIQATGTVIGDKLSLIDVTTTF